MSSNKAKVQTGMRALLGRSAERSETREEEEKPATPPAHSKVAAETREHLSLVETAPPQSEPVAETRSVADVPTQTTPGLDPFASRLEAAVTESAATQQSEGPALNQRPEAQPVMEAQSAPVPAAAPSRAIEVRTRPESYSARTNESTSVASTRVSVGTIDKPALRERDGESTRKYGIVLPINLMDAVAHHCINQKVKQNVWVETVLRAELHRLGLRVLLPALPEEHSDD